MNKYLDIDTVYSTIDNVKANITIQRDQYINGGKIDDMLRVVEWALNNFKKELELNLKCPRKREKIKL